MVTKRNKARSTRRVVFPPTTFRLDKSNLATTDRYLNSVGIKRDAYLNRVLPAEIEELGTHAPNSEEGLSYLRQREIARNTSKAKVSLRLDPKLVKRLNAVCEQKGVPRDLFMETFLDFLANGYENPDDDATGFEDIPSPLAKAAELLSDPFWEANGRPDLYGGRCLITDHVLEAVKNVLRDARRKKSSELRSKDGKAEAD